MTALGIVDVEVVAKGVKEDGELQKIIALLKTNPEGKSRYQLVNEQLLYKERLVIPCTSSLIPSLLCTFHDSILEGYFGFLRTYKRMNGELHWVG